MTAPARRTAARDLLATTTSALAIEQWQRAVLIRREWMAYGLATAPADRIAAEDSLSRVYARHSRPRPRFQWVDSPRQALALLAGLPTHGELQRWVRGRRPPGRPPLASDIAAGLSRLRSALDECVAWRDFDRPAKRPRRSGATREGRGPAPPPRPPREALAAGVPLREVLRRGVREAMETSLAAGYYLPVRAALEPYGPLPVAWYGQQESYWIAHYDVLRRLGIARYRPGDADYLEDWASLARSCGWWWPGEDTCVVVERPAVIRTEPVPGAWDEQVRLPAGRAGEGPVEYRDGWRPLPAPSRSPAPPRAGAGPSGAGPSGAGPSGAEPSGAGPSGAGPSGAGLSGAGPSGAGPSGAGPSGEVPAEGIRGARAPAHRGRADRTPAARAPAHRGARPVVTSR